MFSICPPLRAQTRALATVPPTNSGDSPSSTWSSKGCVQSSAACRKAIPWIRCVACSNKTRSAMKASSRGKDDATRPLERSVKPGDPRLSGESDALFDEISLRKGQHDVRLHAGVLQRFEEQNVGAAGGLRETDRRPETGELLS